MSLTNDELQALIVNLTARVNSIDGINLPPGVKGSIAALQAQVNGVSMDLNQSLLLIQQQLNTVLTQVTALNTLVNTKLGSS